MTRGRKTKPAELKALAGNPGQRPIPGNIPKASGKIGTAPKFMTKQQKAAWRHAIKNAPQDLLTVMDRSVLTVWIIANDLYQQAAAAVELDGLTQVTPKGFEMPSAAVTVMNRQAEVMLRAASEMGFTPSSRTRVGGSSQSTRQGNKFANNGSRRLRAVS